MAEYEREESGLITHDAGIPQWLLRYGFALLVVAVSTAIRYWLGGMFGVTPPYLTFFPAIMLVAIVAGLNPALVGTFLCALAADYFFLKPYGSFAIPDPADRIGLALFMSIGVAISVLAETTRRRNAELRRSRSDLDRAQKIAELGSWYLDIANDVLTWSDESYRLFHVPGGTRLSTEDFFRRIQEEDRQRVLDGWSAALEGAVFDVEHRILVDGELRWVRARAKVEFDDEGKPQFARGTIQDVTDRKRSEEESRRSARYARGLIEASLDPLVTISRKGKITDVNRSTENVTGISREQLVGSDFSDYFTEPEKARQGYEEVFSEGLVRDYPLTIRHVSGQVTDVLYNANLFRDEKGEIEGVFASARDVTRRKRAEQELRNREEQLNGFFNCSPQGMLILDRDYRFLRLNEPLAFINGPPLADQVGKTFREVIPDLAPELERQVQEVFDTGKAIVNFELHGETPRDPGTLRDWAVSYFPIRQEDGRIMTLGGVVVETTERKRAEVAIKTSEQRLNLTLHSAQMGIWELDLINDTVVRDLRHDQIFGHQTVQPQWSREVFLNHVVTEDRDVVANKVRDAFATGSLYLECRIMWPDQSIHWIRAQGAVYRDDQGAPNKMMGTVTDITEHQLAEAARRRIEANLAALIESTRDMIWSVDVDHRVVTFNKALEQHLERDYGGRLAAGMKPKDILPAETAALWQGMYERALAEGPYRIEYSPSDGRSLDLAFNPIVQNGRTTGVSVFAKDITSQKRAEDVVAALNQDLQRRAAELQTLFDTVPIGLAITDDVCGLDVRSNPAQERMLGAPAGGEFSKESSPQGHALRVVKDGLEVPDEALPIQRAVRGEAITGEILEMVRPDGQVITVHASAAPIFDERGQPRGAVSAFVDITEQKRAERIIRERSAELVVVNKELEAFNYAVAHDLRAPLRHIHGFADMLSENVGPALDDSSKRYLQTIQDSVHHMSMLLEDLLRMSRLGRQEIHKVALGLNALVEEVLRSLAPEIKDREVEWRIASLPFLECDSTLMKQVLFNLLSNALKFTRARRPAIIEIGQITVDGEPVVFIRDNGVGFSMKYAEKLFGLFQRLHRQEDFEGTGVGLAIVQRIMHRHGGRVWAEAELNKGATFYLCLHPCETEKKELTPVPVTV